MGIVPPDFVQALCGARRIVARWLDHRGGGRAAGGDGRQWPGSGPDLPQGLAARKRPGRARMSISWRPTTHPAHQSCEGHARCSRGRSRRWRRAAPAASIFRDVKGQEAAKRALEVAAAGGHHLLMVGPPGAGKSMLAQRLPSILPPMDAREMLEASMIASLAGELGEGRLSRRRPFRAPHHSAASRRWSAAGFKAKPGEMALAHHGVLFLDEIAGIPAARARKLAAAARNGRDGGGARQLSRHLSGALPADRRDEPVQMRHGGRAGAVCAKGPRCAADYQGRISGPLARPHGYPDRIAGGRALPISPCRRPRKPAPMSLRASLRRGCGRSRALKSSGLAHLRTNAQADGALLEEIAQPDAAGLQTLARRRRCHGPFGAGLSPRLAGGAHLGRSRWPRADRAAPHRRGPELPPETVGVPGCSLRLARLNPTH